MRSVEVYQVRVFLEVARRLSFTEAADSLNLTQPAVSTKIKLLETELGTPLFYRSARKIQLTEAGQFLLREGAKLLEVETQLLQKIEEIKQGKQGQLTIGCTTSVADGWLPDVIFQYRQKHPHVQTHFQVFQTAEQLYRSLTENQVEVGISDMSFEEFAEISAVPIADMQYSLMVAPDHPLAKRNWLSIKEVQDYNWVLMPSGTPSQLLFESRLSELGLSPTHFAHIETVDTPNLLRTYLIQGNYIGFASNHEFKTDLQFKTLVSIPLQEFALPNHIYLLLSKRSKEIASTPPRAERRSQSSTPLQTFVSFVQSVSSRPHVTRQAQPPIHLRSPSLVMRSTVTQHPEVITLTIGTQNATLPTVAGGLVIQQLGLLEHFLPREGRYSSVQFKIRWQDFALGAPIITGLQSGQLDIGLLGDYPLLLSALSPQTSKKPAVKTRLISFVATNPDGSCNAVIVPNESKFQTIDDLRGHVIAVPWSSSAHGMVMRSLSSANILPDVAITSLDQSTLVHPFAHPTRQADGYAHFAPFHAIACRKGKFRYLLTDDLSGLPSFHGVVVSEVLADHYPEIIVAYLKALRAAQYWCATNPAAVSLISRWTHLDAAIVSSVLQHPQQTKQPGQFFSDMTIHSDWIEQHISQLGTIPGNEQLKTINLKHWIQSDFLRQVQ